MLRANILSFRPGGPGRTRARGEPWLLAEERSSGRTFETSNQVEDVEDEDLDEDELEDEELLDEIPEAGDALLVAELFDEVGMPAPESEED